MQKNVFRKGIVFGLVALLIRTSVISNIGSNVEKDIKKINDKLAEEKDISANIKLNNPENSANAPLDEGLISWWNFNEGGGNTAYDSEGDNDGTIYGATWTTGISGYALSFDGSDDYVDIPNTTDFRFHDESLTFCAWVQIVDNSDHYRKIIGLNGPEFIEDGIHLAKSRSGNMDGRFYMQVYNGVTESCPTSILDGNSLPKNTWIFLAGVVDKNEETVKLYVDGTLNDAEALVSYNLSDLPWLKLNIGSSPTPGWHSEYDRFKGLIDEVRIYNIALSDSEIQYLYNNPGGENQGLVSYWDFDDGSGNIAHDSFGDNDGTIYGATWTSGKSGYALDFDGSDDYVDVPDHDSLSFGEGSNDYPFTCAAWIKRSSTGEKGTILSKYNSYVNPRRQEYIFMVGSDDKLHVSIWDTPTSTYVKQIKTIATIDTSWHFVTATYDGSGLIEGLKLYIDGMEQVTSIEYNDPNYIAMHNTDESFKIGRTTENLGEWSCFKGLIDEVRIYNIALSDDEIWDLYGGGNQDDLYITKVEPCQVVWPEKINYDYPYIAYKDTFAKVTVQNTFDHAVRVAFALGNPQYYLIDIGSNGKGILLNSGLNTVWIPGGPSSAEPDPWLKNYGGEINWFPPGEDQFIVVMVDVYNDSIESNEDNNFGYYMDIDVQASIDFDVLYTRLKPGWGHSYSVPNFKDFYNSMVQGTKFMNYVYPLSYNAIHMHYTTKPLPGKFLWLRDLDWLDQWATASNVYRVVAIVSDSYFEEHNLKDENGNLLSGFCHPWFTSGVVRVSQWATIAHELHHNIPPEDGYYNGIFVKGDWRLGNEEYDTDPPGGKPASGFRHMPWLTNPVFKHMEIFENSIGGTCYMGSTYGDDELTIINAHVCNECYEHLLPVFKYSGSSKNNLVKVIYISGIVDKNNTGNIERISIFDNRTVLIPSTNHGNYSIKLLNQNNDVIYEIFFDLMFNNTGTDYDGFAFKLPYYDGISKIRFDYKNVTISEKIRSYNTPTVNILTPKDGDKIYLGNNCLITWNATDMDGDDLQYLVGLSTDDGNKWTLLEADYNKTELLWNTTYQSPGDECIIRVFANDGFNTAFDDSAGTFSLINSPPDTPSITGPRKGKTGVNYEYKIVIVDPNSDLLNYFIDWGDGLNTSLVRYYESGEKINISHNWSKSGTYTIKLKAIDMHDAESDWATLTVSMPKNKAIILNSLFLKLLGKFPILERLLLMLNV